MSSVELAAEAARCALEDTGAGFADVAASTELIADVRQFEISAPVPAPLGRSDNYPRSVARRLGIEPARAVLEVVGGQGPQPLVTEFAGAIAAGRLGSVLIAGSDAVSTERFYSGRDDRPDFTEKVPGQLEGRGFGYESFGLDEITTFDLYSCFPIAVFNLCDGTGLSTTDPRGLTVTGGPGNNYSMHAIAETVGRTRDQPGAFGLVAANGGIMSKYSVGVHSTVSADWEPDNSLRLQSAVAAAPGTAHRSLADGPARIETYTVRHAFEPRTGVVIGRLHADGSRFLATMSPESLVTVDDPIGRDIIVTSSEQGNTAAMVS
ncbi:hypothetical protein [Nocardia vinacea]|uniref:hypothetical protein n=1 Tax=Nocardia vinacea TaxID=96468 RepID=UPI0002D93976|nr:hypothetical protein [Nocardia vinacea]